MGTTSTVSNGFIIDNEVGSRDVLRRYTDERIVINLPKSNNVCNLNFFSVYCVDFTTVFGIVYLQTDFACSGCPISCVTNNGGTGSLPFQCVELSSENS
ncbi:DM13 domain-containing protein, partial [Salmonella sp. s51228]|uniref:DM13 domain-containing protein n=1 Tax=Salmonella sp. s51228 TaxID=3159652 RepID=UPI00397F1C46